MRKVCVLLLSTLVISLFASMGIITPASAAEPTYFAIGPIFDPGSWTEGTIFALDLTTDPPAPFVPLMGASFEAYEYFETVQEEEPQRVCHYKALITCDDGSTLEWYWKTEWNLDPYIYTYDDGAKGVATGVLTHGTGALKGFHGKTYVEVRVYPDGATINPELGAPQVGAIDPTDPELCWATYHIDPSK